MAAITICSDFGAQKNSLALFPQTRGLKHHHGNLLPTSFLSATYLVLAQALQFSSPKWWVGGLMAVDLLQMKLFLLMESSPKKLLVITF